jgi:DNA-binding winged helix-turn-helix (wHTH) protein
MPSDRVRFGDDFELDRTVYELRRSGRALKLERIPMEILFLLVERKGQLVAREEIIGRVWGKDVYLDTDNSINSAIRKIRQVLKDDSENPVYVQTVTGKGYRFIAPLTEVSIPASHSDEVSKQQALAPPTGPALAAPAAAHARFGSGDGSCPWRSSAYFWPLASTRFACGRGHAPPLRSSG